MTRRRVVALVWLAPAAIFVAVTALVQAHYRLEVPPRLGPDARAEAIAVLRAGLEDAPAPAPVHLGRPLAPGPLVASLWLDGRRLARVEASGATVADAAIAAGRLLASSPAVASLSSGDRTRARLQVDLVVARGPLGAGSALFDWVGLDDLDELVALHPGLDGLGATVTFDGHDRDVLMLPDELVQTRLLDSRRPVETIPDWKMGTDLDRADALLAQRAALPPGAWGASPRRLWRLRTDSFVERPADQRGDGPPLALDRGVPPGPDVTASSLRAGALAGARYLVAHLAPNGRYLYERNLATGEATDPSVPGPYSIPRHAGTTYFLAEVYRLTGEGFLREPIERAFAHLEELIVAGGCTGTTDGGADMACVIDRGERRAALGSTALTVVALVEYQRATQDARYLPLARRLAEWLLFMQRPDGSFAHVYNVVTRVRDEDTQLFYYSGEAALALARMHAITDEARYAEAAGRALDWLVDWYDFFLGGFIVGEEHWTCIAAEAAWPAVKAPKLRDFCHGYASFLRAQQRAPGGPGGADQADLLGAYGITPFVMPYNTPAGSRTEAMISAYGLGRHHGRPDERIRQQVLAALQYTLRQQIRPDSDWNVATADGVGAIAGSPVDRVVRIDYVQHVGSSMIRAVSLVEPGHP